MCFPSFHVIWAVLSARALWGFRRLRIPVSMLAGLLSVSTMTTGWHYFVDVLGGLVVAEVSILAAKAYLLGWKEIATQETRLCAAHRIQLTHCRTNSGVRQMSRSSLAFQILLTSPQTLLLYCQSHLRLLQLLFQLIAFFSCFPDPLLSRLDVGYRAFV